MKCERSPLGLGVSSCIKHDKYRFGIVSGVIPCTVCGASVVSDVAIVVAVDVANDVCLVMLQVMLQVMLPMMFISVLFPMMLPMMLPVMLPMMFFSVVPLLFH